MTDKTIASFRRVNPAILASARMAMANDVPDTSKAEISLLLKKAAPILGIDGTTYHVLDILLGLSRADDWKGAGRPVVAISNAKLAEYTRRSERTVIRCLRRIVEAGIAAYRDSPTGRRFVHRDDQGGILSGFGLDFTPARVRLDELRQSVERYLQEVQALQAARRDVTRLSRAVLDAGEAFPEMKAQWSDEALAAMNATAGLLEQAAMLEALHTRVLQHAEMVFEQEKTCVGDIHDTSIINTNPENHSDSKKWTRSKERDMNSTDVGYAAELAFEKKPPTTVANKQATDPDRRQGIETSIPATVSIDLLKSACRSAQELLDGEFMRWSDVTDAAETMRVMIGLSEAAWKDACSRIGRHAAGAILATVLEKSLRDPDQISKPGGYFRAMVDRAAEGNLYLAKSLHGLADAAFRKKRRESQL